MVGWSSILSTCSSRPDPDRSTARDGPVPGGRRRPRSVAARMGRPRTLALIAPPLDESKATPAGDVRSTVSSAMRASSRRHSGSARSGSSGPRPRRGLVARHRGSPLRAADIHSGARLQNAAGLQRLARRIEPVAGWSDLVVLPPSRRPSTSSRRACGTGPSSSMGGRCGTRGRPWRRPDGDVLRAERHRQDPRRRGHRP